MDKARLDRVHRLDEAIDRAVSEMVGGDPAPGLRARVLERIGTGPAGGPASSWWAGVTVLPMAAVAVIAVAARRCS